MKISQYNTPVELSAFYWLLTHIIQINAQNIERSIKIKMTNLFVKNKKKIRIGKSLRMTSLQFLFAWF